MRSAVAKFLVTSVALVILGGASLAMAKTPHSAPLGEASENSVTVAALPLQGQQTYRLILQGGPFPYDKDGVVFGNRERLLPAQKRGYYHEYTVKTPGSRDRGARRIVCGGQPKAPDACFYSDDHYSSFRKIVP
jgi:ribonuclease T1